MKVFLGKIAQTGQASFQNLRGKIYFDQNFSLEMRNYKLEGGQRDQKL